MLRGLVSNWPSQQIKTKRMIISQQPKIQLFKNIKCYIKTPFQNKNENMCFLNSVISHCSITDDTAVVDVFGQTE
jgi:hypothetical protein